MIKQFLTDCDMVLFLCMSADVAQILQQHDASSVSQSKSGGTTFTDSYFFGNFTDS